jgi:methylenetetrahydrofolate--tRNA-(uracil-5-)-methyltransferase
MTPAHTGGNFAELVCSNSFRGNELTSAAGLLKEELRRLGSLIMDCAEKTSVAAGGALAVDREAFSELVTKRLQDNALVEIVYEEALDIPPGYVVIATGPLTSDGLSERIGGLFPPDSSYLNFFDAVAPIVTLESIDMDRAFYASRYDKGTDDYINCPMTKDEYIAFWAELKDAKTAEVHGFEEGMVFEGCVPIEVMAQRGEDTMRYGPLKPVGLKNPATGEEYYAVVQLRRDNASGSLYNLVGFQTHLSFSEQRRVFSMIPGLAEAEFVRYGVMHRNTYIDSPRLLDRYYQIVSEPRVSFAGQITGVEGYIESCASGLLRGLELANLIQGRDAIDFPRETAIGALALYVSDGSITNFQPMNINFGIISPLGHKVKGKRNKNMEISKRSLEIIDSIAGEVCL